MKNLILLIAIIVIVFKTEAQKLTVNEVPAAVMAKFNRANSSIKNVDWSKQGNYYKAEFDTNKVETAITYDVKGRLIETEVAVPKSSLPPVAIEYMKQNYKGEMKETSKIKSGKGVITYEADIDSTGLIFNSKGTLIKSIKVLHR